MRRTTLVTTVLLCLVLSAAAFGQTGNGSISGIVQDPQKALIPGVTVTVTNTQTGVKNSTVTNESGAYNFPSLIPGLYTATAELPGFQTYTYNEIQLGGSAQIRLDFTLQVGPTSERVEVTVAADTLLKESSPSIGETLNEQRVQNLPIVGNDVLDLVKILPGYRQSALGQQFDTFAGVGALQINTVRDGLSVTDGRFPNGITANTLLNPDLVGEIRLILTPVDAELGRGNGQVQITTRSGTNQFHGSGVWNIRNTALNPNTWANNRNVDPLTGKWKPTPANWENDNQLTGSVGGPIIKNKTFFYTLYDKQIDRRKTTVDGLVLTDSARNGVFRYFQGWNAGGWQTNIPTTFPTATTAAYPVVDFAGNPIYPAINQSGTPYSFSSPAGLVCFSVFGTKKLDGSLLSATDCPNGHIVVPPNGGQFWDNNRIGLDTTGYIRKVFDAMPHANYFGANGTDGLNVASYRWTRSAAGSGSIGEQEGTSNDNDRSQINIKIDHNFNSKHKFAAAWSYEKDTSGLNLSNWPTGLNGDLSRRPQTLTVNGTSTLSSNLVNEPRFGIRYSNLEDNMPFDSTNPDTRAAARKLFIPAGADPGYTRATGTTVPVLISPGAGMFAFGGTANGLAVATGSLNGNYSPLFSFGDNLSWTHGKHAYKFGAELRRTNTNGYNNLPNPVPVVTGGVSTSSTFISPLASAITDLPNQLTGVRTNAANMLYLLAGSISSVSQAYWIDNAADVKEGKWQGWQSEERKYRNEILNEWDAFVKDDWKISKNLTLNLGLRYEFYGAPYIKQGFTTNLVGQGVGLFGQGVPANGNLFSQWLIGGKNLYLTGYGPNGTLTCANAVQQSAALPKSTCDPAKLSTFQFIGPNSPNPGLSVVRNDWNNFGPAIGFAWQAPWFGHRTTVRGGYQLTYGGSGRQAGGGLTTDDQVLGAAPGATSTASTLISDFSDYLDFTDISRLAPVRPTTPVLPGGQIQVFQRAGSAIAYDPNFATPYTQNFTLAVTTNVRRNVTMDVRYIGTQSKKQQGDVNLNIPNVYYNKELFDALEITRQGGDAPLFNQMLAGLNLNSNVVSPNGTTYGPVGTVVNGILQTGSAQLRRSATFAQNIANGNYPGVVTSLMTLAPTGLIGPATIGGAAVGNRVLRNGCDRLANGQTTVGSGDPTVLRCFPEDYFTTNSQLSGATFRTNDGSSNYHSMQAQMTFRPTYGMSFQTTYTFSKTMGIPAGLYTDPLNPKADYSRSFSSVTNDFRTNGTFELPVGPGKLLFSKSSGVLGRMLERWQVGMILNMYSGRPSSITATWLSGFTTINSGLYNNGVADIVGPISLNSGNLKWDGSNNRGFYFGDPSPFVQVADPQCATVNHTDTMGFNLSTNNSCTITAVAKRNSDGTAGQILLQNPLPGHRGNIGQSTIETPGVRQFDANISKTIRISETNIKSLQLRIDCTNVLNHPTPSAPNLNINTANFGTTAGTGAFGGKTGNRAFQGQVRLNF